MSKVQHFCLKGRNVSKENEMFLYILQVLNKKTLIVRRFMVHVLNHEEINIYH